MIAALPFLVKASLSFSTTVLVAVCWALYFRYSAEQRPLAAAVVDTTLVALGMFNILGYTEDHRLAGPILAATFIGTFAAIELKRAKAKKEKPMWVKVMRVIRENYP